MKRTRRVLERLGVRVEKDSEVDELASRILSTLGKERVRYILAEKVLHPPLEGMEEVKRALEEELSPKWTPPERGVETPVIKHDLKKPPWEDLPKVSFAEIQLVAPKGDSALLLMARKSKVHRLALECTYGMLPRSATSQTRLRLYKALLKQFKEWEDADR